MSWTDGFHEGCRNWPKPSMVGSVPAGLGNPAVSFCFGSGALMERISWAGVFEKIAEGLYS